MQVVTETVRLTRAQKAFRDSRAPYRAFVGGRGAGKSWVGAYDLLCRARRGRLYMVVAPTYPMLSDATFRTFLEVGRALEFVDPADVRRSPPSVRLTTGAEVIFRSADEPERLRGPNLSGAWLDEGSLLAKDAYDIVIACLREGGEQGWLSNTFTPKGRKSWTYDVFGTGRPDTALFHSRTQDNPFLPPQFAATVARQYPSALAAQELGGEFVDPEGGLYKVAWFGEFSVVGNDGYQVAGRFVRRDSCLHFGVVDPAVGKNAGSDPVGVAAFAATPDGDLLWLYGAAEPLKLEGIAPRLERLEREWRLDFVGCEANGFQMWVAREIRSRLRCPVKELSPEGKTKVVRSYPAIVLAEQGRVRVPRGAAWLEAALYELTSWTGKDGEADHVADCLAYGVRLAAQSKGGRTMPMALGV